MIIALSVIGFLILILIYFFVRAQAIERELKQTMHQAKIAGSQAKQALMSVDVLALEIQKSLLEKLDAAQKRKLIDGDNYNCAKALFSKFERVVMLCSEFGMSVSEATKKSFTNSDPDFDKICEYVGSLPNEVKLPWSRNDINSFVNACSNIIKHINAPGSASGGSSDKKSDSPQPLA